MPKTTSTKKSRHSHHQTQWAAQFGVASELCKRGYQVALTMGNHPAVDMLVQSPEGRQFKIDVKGLYRPNYWIIKRKPLEDNLFFVLAFVPMDQPSEFFVLSHAEVIASQAADIERGKLKNPAIDHTYPVQGVLWGASKVFRDRWETLPA